MSNIEAQWTSVQGCPIHFGITDHNTRHETVNHSTEQWVMGDVAASMHGVGSLLKRSIVGSDPKIIVKHMDRYLKEMQWTFNGRGNPHILCDNMSRIVNTVFFSFVFPDLY